MVSGRRPLWIHRIKQRVSLSTFKFNAKRLKDCDENIRLVLKGNPRKHVYEVTVETMEGSDDDCFEDIWVPDELAETTGEMLERFEDKLEEIEATQEEEDETIPEEIVEDIDREYEELCSAEPSEPDFDDTKDSFEFSDSEDVTEKQEVKC